MRVHTAGLLLAASLFLSTGCGEDNSTDAGDTFTNAEASEVFSAVDEIMTMFTLFEGPGGDGAVVGIAAQPAQVSETHSCPGGGSASVTGTVTETTTTLDGTITVSISSCVVRNGTATIGGGFTIVATGRSSGTNQFTITLAADGDLTALLSSGRQRTCHVDYTQTNVINIMTGAQTETKAGTFCGRAASGIVP